MKTIRSVGLKYCGGCNPRYDRVETLRRISDELGGTVRFVSPDDPGVGSVLVVMGCETACADLSSLKDRRIWIITGRGDADAWIADIKKVL